MTNGTLAKFGAALPNKKIIALGGLLSLQVFCALFFLSDVAVEQFGLESGLDELIVGSEHLDIELIVASALILSIAFTALGIREVVRRNRRMEKQLKAAAGAFYEMLEDRFDDWSLTGSERDVALLAIKGMSIAEIAEARRTKDGTIKAQCNSIYRKAGVTGRPQLLSLFIDELLEYGSRD